MYVIVWRFTVKPEAVADFERAYGPAGDWVRIFRNAPGFVRTDLLKDTSQPNVYLTLDHWRDEAAFAAFNPKANAAYVALDAVCEAYTLHEEKLGAFSA
ncbi:MAG: antibiotic biosynthesis monooxygenase [Rhodospirillaceae bacterium]|nr:antibiotic biosynthesis monooxygenase [Rhodospirillaceae bacterium]